MADYSGTFSFYSPEKQHWIEVENLRLAAIRWGLRFEVIEHHRFRNLQRFGTPTVQTFIRLHGDDPDLITRFINGIHVS